MLPEPETFRDAAAYNPATGKWRKLPLPRRAFAALWTGHQMIVWGGYTTTSYFDGAAFTPR